jgi:hypothetical protein
MESDAKEWLIKRIEDKEKSVPKVIHFGNITFCG